MTFELSLNSQVSGIDLKFKTYIPKITFNLQIASNTGLLKCHLQSALKILQIGRKIFYRPVQH